MISNTEWKKVTASLIAAVIFSLICIISYFTIDGMSGGYALAFISFFLAVSSVVVTLLFVHRALVMDGILTELKPLAHWIYPEEMAKKSVEREYRNYQERNRAMFIIIGGMLVLVSLFFMIFIGEGGLQTGIFLLAFTGFLFIVSRVAPGLERRRAMEAPHEALITRTGIIYEGAVYPFRSFLVTWDGVSLRNADKKNPAVMVFSFTQLNGRFIVQPFDVVIPVPAGEEEKAVRIVRELGGEVPDD
ncbi:MAG: hypothetical protein Q8S57_05700 [Methanoregula sp.]|nr:hypothetical protein [Methanoregula sp.]